MLVRPTSNLKRTDNPGCKECEFERRGDHRRKHGESKSRLYWVWKAMRARCNDEENPSYGAKGIKVCAAWQDYSTFKRWATLKGYANGLTIDRIDPDKGYGPKNCEWVTKDENSRRVARPRIVDLTIEAILSAT